MIATAPGHAPPVKESQADVLAFLETGGAFYPDGVPQRIDTHAASIFLAGDRAWKLKRAVRFGYLDFSTPGKRREALESELRLNRRTAPDLYRAVHAVTRASGGQLEIDGAGEIVDWLLEMRRFPDGALLADMADRDQLDDRVLTRLSDRIISFHADAEVVPVEDATGRFSAVIDGNFTSLATFPELLDPTRTALLEDLHRSAATALTPLLDARGRAGRVRHAHGDLHLANIALIDGEPTLFDCLEFNPSLATIDVLYDLAFPLMDLWHRDMGTEANMVFNRYLDLSPADEAGIALMPLFLSVRATVRAHVVAAQAARGPPNRALIDRARSYLDLAIELMEAKPPRLVAIGGLSGTGKSSLARMLGGDIGRPPGARILRTDVLRKRLAGVLPEMPLPAASYSSASSDRVYTMVGTMTATLLAAGQAVITDAVFARRREREVIEQVATAAHCRFDGLWLTVADTTMFSRIASREDDASDADVDVARAQLDLDIGDLGDWQPLRTDGAMDHVRTKASAMIATSRSGAIA